MGQNNNIDSGTFYLDTLAITIIAGHNDGKIFNFNDLGFHFLNIIAQ
jgi:hypothetical protein